MKLIPNAVSGTVARRALILQKHSPRLMFTVGVTGIVAGTVLACRATMKLEDTLDILEADVDYARNTSADEKVKVRVYLNGAGQIAKLYAPSAIVLTTSIGLVTGSHVVLSRRNAGLTAAYAALDRTYDEYRERVREQLGEEKELRLHNAIEKIDVVDEDGKKIKADVVDPNKVSIYAKFFDEYNRNWDKNPEYNRVFVKSAQDYANQMLHARRHVFLNEVYEALGMEHTSAGAIVGWVIGEEGDNYIDFGMHEVRNKDFINGKERSILLDFNVDGVIYDLI